jgi:hypothetical protein
MNNLRCWQYLLSLLLLIGLFDVLYMIVDIEGTMAMREQLLDLMTYGEGVEGTARAADLIPQKVLTFATLALGALLVWRALHLRSAQALLAFIIIFNVPAYTLVKFGLPVEMLYQASMVANVAWLLPLVAFAALFPRRLTIEDLAIVRKSGGRIRRVLGAPFRWLRAKTLNGQFAASAAVVVLALSAWPGGLLPLIFTLVLLWLAASYLRVGYLVADAEGQRRVLWIVNGFSAAFWLMLVGISAIMVAAVSVGISHGIEATLGDELGAASQMPYWLVLASEWVYILALLGILASIAAAMLYRGALDPGLVLRRTTVYGALGVCVAFLFAVLENILSSQVAMRLGMPGATGSWLAGGVTALTVGPLHHRIKRRTDRIIDRLLPGGSLEQSTDEGVLLCIELEGHGRLVASDPELAGTATSLLQKVAQRAANRFRGQIVESSEGSAELEIGDHEQASLAANFVADAFAAAAEVMELPPLKVNTDIREQSGESRGG